MCTDFMHPEYVCALSYCIGMSTKRSIETVFLFCSQKPPNKTLVGGSYQNWFIKTFEFRKFSNYCKIIFNSFSKADPGINNDL